MTDDDLDIILALTHETPGVEFKGSGARGDRAFFAKVVRAMLGMANRRDGGVVVIGVEDHSGGLRVGGVHPDALASWTYDDVAGAMAPYADPSVQFTVSVKARASSSLVVIEVSEFDRVPVVCIKQYDEPGGSAVLKKGALYVRSRGVPATTELAAGEQLRDLLELAVEKGVRQFLATARRAGIQIDELLTRTDLASFDTQKSHWDD